MLRTSLRSAATLALFLGAVGADAGSETFRVELCIDGRCKNGRIHSVAVADDHFIVIVDPNGCNGRGYCPSRYARIVVEDRTPLRIEGYEPGTASNESFTVYVPRRYKTLYLYGINDPDRSAAIDLRQYEVRSAGRVGAAPDVAPVIAAAAAPAEASPAVAVVFGIEHYRYAPAARHASTDAAAVRDRLVGVLGLDPDDVLFRVDADATAGEWAMALSPRGWLARRAGAGTDVLVYIAGHGMTDPESGAAVLLPQDLDPGFPAAGYALTTLLADLAALDAASVTVALDVAFGGQTRTGERLASGEAAHEPLATIEAPGGVVLFVAAGRGTNGIEASRQNGRFTWHWLAGLAGAADADGDLGISAGELQDWLELRLAAEPGGAGGQQPRLVGDRGARLPFTGGR